MQGVRHCGQRAPAPIGAIPGGEAEMERSGVISKHDAVRRGPASEAVAAAARYHAQAGPAYEGERLRNAPGGPARTAG